MERVLDLSFLKEHPIWTGWDSTEKKWTLAGQPTRVPWNAPASSEGVRLLPPWERVPASPFSNAYGRARRREREELAAWCRDWRPDQVVMDWVSSLRQDRGCASTSSHKLTSGMEMPENQATDPAKAQVTTLAMIDSEPRATSAVKLLLARQTRRKAREKKEARSKANKPVIDVRFEQAFAEKFGAEVVRQSVATCQ